jgi:glycosyltransferase involved in cell wall biosynthesis
VTFTGALPDAAMLISQADAFILPSDGESFGLAALEALSSGVPVVGARAGGLPEVVRDGEDGILEPVGDVEAMGRRLSMMLADPVMHRRFKEAARRHVEQQFRTDLVVPHYEDLYRATIASRAGSLPA